MDKWHDAFGHWSGDSAVPSDKMWQASMRDDHFSYEMTMSAKQKKSNETKAGWFFSVSELEPF